MFFTVLCVYIASHTKISFLGSWERGCLYGTETRSVIQTSVREGRISQGKPSADREATEAHTRLEVIIEWLVTIMDILNSYFHLKDLLIFVKKLEQWSTQ